jgi:hypothetical protein
MIKLILVRRNEAICCLIGFSIGIGCCLMYRWIRNTFFSLEFRNSYQRVTNSSGEENRSASLLVKLNNKLAGHTHPGTSHLLRSSSTSHYDHSSNSNLLFDTSWPNQAEFFYNKKPTAASKNRANSARSSNRNYFSNRGDSFWSRGNSKQRSFDYYSSSNNTSKSQSQSRFSSSYNLNNDFINNCYDDPLNDVYQNLAKFLNKQFCKTFKLRHRANLNKKYNKSTNYFDIFNNKNASFTSVKPQPKKPNESYTSTNLINQNKTFENLNLNIKNNNNNNNDEINTSFDDKSSIKSNSSIAFDDDYDLTQTNPGDEITMNEKLMKYNDGVSPFHHNNLNKKIDNDNMSMDSFMTDDPLNDASKLLFPTESVDKSLEEALHHIDMLKEDMSHLCKDIDTLYNTKSNDKTNLLNDYSSSQLSINKLLSRNQNQQSTHHSSNSSLVNNNDEINDVINRYKLSLESNQLKKCCCIYSDMITLFNLENRNVNIENNSGDEIIYYDDKYAQTNVDSFLSTPSMSTSTSTSTSFNRFSLLNRKNTNANIIASNKYSRRRYFLTNKYTKKPNGLYVLSASPSMTTSSSLNYCSLTQKKRVPKKSKILLHR